MTPKITVDDAAKFMASRSRPINSRDIWNLMVDFANQVIASHAPSALNRNDIVEYWMARATTAELKLQEFAKLLDESKANAHRLNNLGASSK